MTAAGTAQIGIAHGPADSHMRQYVAHTSTLMGSLCVCVCVCVCASCRRGPQRAECAEAAATWWLPLWTEQWARTVDVSSLQSRTQGKSVLDIIKKAASEL